MSINVTGPDGKVHTFPNGTSSADIDRAMQRAYGTAPSQRRATAAAARAVARPNRRSAWERLVDVAQDTFATSAPGQLNRRADPNANGFDLGDLWQAPQLREGGLIDRGLDAVAGQDRGFLRGTDTTSEADRQERARREGFATRSRTDSFLQQETLAGKALHGGAALTGTLLATAADPTSWVTAGRSLVTRAVTQMGVAGGVDIGVQVSDLAAGVSDRYDAARTALSVAAGGAFSVLGDGAAVGLKRLFQRVTTKPEAAAAPDLEVGDQLLAPALTQAEIEPTPPRPTAPEPEPRRATEGITVEAPDGVTYDVPAVVRDGDTGGPRKGPEEAPEGKPTGNGEAGWQDVDWGNRKSPERAAAAARHLDGLQRWIKPEHVQAFTRLLDEGIPDADKGVHINERWVDWDKMGDPNEILGFTNAMADIFKSVYDKAGDAKQGWDETAKIARQMGFTLSDIIKTHADITGEGGITARAGALRDAALASDKDFAERLAATRAALAAGDKSGLPALTEALNRTIVLGAMDAGASSEIARALQYRQRLGKPKFPTNDLQAALDELSAVMNKGQEMDDAALGKMLDELSDAYDKGGSAGLRQRIRTMRELGFMDYVGYYTTASLLSAPTTHIRNLTGTPIHALFQVGERYVAAGIGAARTSLGLGSRERVTFREALAYTAGVTQAWSEGLDLGLKAFIRGAPVTDPRSSVMSTEQAMQVPFAFSRERAAGWLQNPASPKTWADAAGTLVFAIQRTLGFRPSVAADEFYKAFGRRMELNALAHREAAYRAAIAGPEKGEAVYEKTLAAMRDQPTADAFREAQAFFSGQTPAQRQGVFEPGSREEEFALILRSIDQQQMAVDHAQLLTFQTAGPMVEAWDKALRATPLIKHFYVNFIRTPIAILKAGMVDRNPIIGGAVALAGLADPKSRVKTKALWDALTSEEQALARGGAEADLVIARQVVGSAVLGTLWMLWAGDGIVGKQSPEERREGVLDYSFKLPNGEWVQYTGLSPLGEMIGLVADTAAEFRKRNPTDAEAASIMGAVAAAVRNNITNKSFLKGLSDFMEMMNGGAYGAPTDSAKSGEQMLKSLGESIIPRAVPGGALLRRVAQDQDPVIRDARSWTEQLWAGIPLMSDELAARRDFLGRPLIRKPGERGAFQAFNTSRPTEDKLEKALAEIAVENPSFRIGMTPRGDMSPQEYSRLLEVQGQLYRERGTGMNMEERLRDLVSTPDFRNSPPEAREYQVKRIIERFRTLANRAVRDPRSEFYMAEYAKRTGLRDLEKRAKARGWSADQTLANATRYGLDRDDPDVQALHDALFDEE